MALFRTAVMPGRCVPFESIGTTILESIRVSTPTPKRLFHSSLLSLEIEHDAQRTLSAPPPGRAACGNLPQLAEKTKGGWTMFAACFASFGIGTWLGAAVQESNPGGLAYGKKANAANAWPSYFPPNPIPTWSLPSLSISNSARSISFQSSPLSGATAGFLEHTKFQHISSPEDSEQSPLPSPPSPASVVVRVPDHLKSRESAKPLPEPAEPDPTASIRPYLKPSFIADAAAKASPAVVNVAVSSDPLSYFGGLPTTLSGGSGTTLSGGSGFLIEADGTILTNAHVVAQVTDAYVRGKITITIQDGREFEGKVISCDTRSDIALVKIDSKTPLPFMKLGESGKLRAGDWVVALGSPLHLKNTVTCGIVSATRKSSELGVMGGRTSYIQTDAAINQGNSGGPLVDLDGKVIGICTMKALSADGVSFAIPIDTARRVVEQLAKHGRVIWPYVGMKMLELTPPVISAIKGRNPLFPDVSAGVLVSQVTPGSPAEKGGLMSGDVVVNFDGQRITTVAQLFDALGDKAGAKIEVVVKRPRGITATIVIIPEEGAPNSPG